MSKTTQDQKKLQYIKRALFFKERNNDILNRYIKGENIQEISKAKNIKPKFIREVLRKKGVKIRERKRTRTEKQKH